MTEALLEMVLEKMKLRRQQDDDDHQENRSVNARGPTSIKLDDVTRDEVRSVIGYVRVSTAEQGRSGLSLATQRAAIEKECRHRGWRLVAVHEDVTSGGKLNGRPGLGEALADLAARKADALVVAKLDRLSRSLPDFGRVVNLSRRHGWPLLILDPDIDTTGPFGEMMAGVLISLANWERRMVAERTKVALAAKREQGGKLGRERLIPPEVEARIVKMRRKGLSFQAIADKLSGEGQPTANGGDAWHWATIQRVVRRSDLVESVRTRDRRARLE